MSSLSIDMLGPVPADPRGPRGVSAGTTSFAALVAGLGGQAAPAVAGTGLPDDRQKLAAPTLPDGPGAESAADLAALLDPDGQPASGTALQPADPAAPAPVPAIGVCQVIMPKRGLISTRLDPVPDPATGPEPAPPTPAIGICKIDLPKRIPTGTQPDPAPAPAVGTCEVIVPRLHPIATQPDPTPEPSDPASTGDQTGGRCEVVVPTLPRPDAPAPEAPEVVGTAPVPAREPTVVGKPLSDDGGTADLTTPANPAGADKASASATGKVRDLAGTVGAGESKVPVARIAKAAVALPVRLPIEPAVATQAIDPPVKAEAEEAPDTDKSAAKAEDGPADPAAIPASALPVAVTPPAVAVPSRFAVGNQPVRTIGAIVADRAAQRQNGLTKQPGTDTGQAAATVPAPSAPQATIVPAQLALAPDAATLQAIAALIRNATDEAADRALPIDSASPTVPTIQAVAAPSAPARVELPFAAAPAPVVDTRRAEWIEALVDRIDEQRGHGGRSVHIALSPDALGGVEVQMRQEGDRVHIAFSTDTAQARALLADAAPRLAQLADARGLKLGDTGVEQHQQGQRHAAPGQPDTPEAPAPAFIASDSGDAAEAASDRIA